MSFEVGTPIHCIELETGSGLTGTLLVTEKTMRADIYDYSDFFFIKPEQPIYLRTAANDIVSLYSNISAGPGTASRMIDPVKNEYQTTHHQVIISNVVVVGGDRWQEVDRVKRVHFTVKHVDHLLRHREKIAALSNSRTPKEEHFRLYQDKAQGMTLSAWYGANYGMELDSPKAIWPTFAIEFDEPLGIHEYLRHVSDYAFFWSFCVGVRLKPRDIHIDRMSFAEMQEAVTARTYLSDHQVYYVWDEEKFEQRDTAAFGSPVRAYDDDALASLRTCLLTWMNRAEQWHKPYSLMMGSLALRNDVSAERLINACRWLDEIPLARPKNGLPKKDVQMIANAASDKALELGHDKAVRERIKNAVRWVRVETSEGRFSRLVERVEDKFGKGILPANVVKHLTGAIQFRGRVAHGHFEPSNDAEHQAFYKSMRAVEALCLLLTAVDLPISEEGCKNIASHPLVEGYMRAYE